MKRITKNAPKTQSADITQVVTAVKEIKINPEFQSLTVDRVFVLKNE